MSSDKGIPVLNRPVDMMEAGVNGINLASLAMQRHPIEKLQECQCKIRPRGCGAYLPSLDGFSLYLTFVVFLQLNFICNNKNSYSTSLLPGHGRGRGSPPVVREWLCHEARHRASHGV